MIQLKNGQYAIGLDDGYQFGKTANFIFENGVHMLGNAEPALKEKGNLPAVYTKLIRGLFCEKVRFLDLIG